MYAIALEQKPPRQTNSARSLTQRRICSPQIQRVPSILNLQRCIGNQAIQRMLQANADGFETDSTNKGSAHLGYDVGQIPGYSPTTSYIQPKLMVNSPGDIYEQEADRVATDVMRMPDTTTQAQANNSYIQKYGCSPEKPMQRRSRSVNRRKIAPLSVRMARNQCNKLDQVILKWVLGGFMSYAKWYWHINKYTKYIYWKQLSKHSIADIDIYFKPPGRRERHNKVIVQIKPPFLRGLLVDARLYSWLGKYPIERRHWRGILVHLNRNCVIVNIPPPKRKRPSPGPGPSRPGPSGATGVA